MRKSSAFVSSKMRRGFEISIGDWQETSREDEILVYLSLVSTLGSTMNRVENRVLCVNYSFFFLLLNCLVSNEMKSFQFVYFPFVLDNTPLDLVTSFSLLVYHAT